MWEETNLHDFPDNENRDTGADFREPCPKNLNTGDNLECPGTFPKEMGSFKKIMRFLRQKSPVLLKICTFAIDRRHLGNSSKLDYTRVALSLYHKQMR